MSESPMIGVLRALNNHEIVYVVTGRVAEAAYGKYYRFSIVLELMMPEDDANFRRAMRVLEDLGYRMAFEGIGIEHEGATIRIFHHDQYPSATLNLMLGFPGDFRRELCRAQEIEFADDVRVPLIT